VDCLRGWLTDRARGGSLPDFAAPVDVSIGQWAHALAQSNQSERVLDPVLQQFVRAVSAQQVASLARTLPLLHDLQDLHASGALEDQMSHMRAEMAILEEQTAALALRMRAMRDARGVLNNLTPALASDAARSVRDLLNSATLAGALPSAALARAETALVLPCARCSGHWSSSGRDAACTQCGALHCARCGDAVDSVDSTAAEAPLSPHWAHVGGVSEEQYDRKLREDQEQKEEEEQEQKEEEEQEQKEEEQTSSGHVCDASSAAALARLVATSRNCPQCGALVSRKSACPHMKCALCHARFNIETGSLDEHAHLDESGVTRLPVSVFGAGMGSALFLMLRIPHANIMVALQRAYELRTSLDIPARAPVALISVTDSERHVQLREVAEDGAVEARASHLLRASFARHLAEEVRTVMRRLRAREQSIEDRTSRARSTDGDDESVLILSDWRFIVRQLSSLLDLLPRAWVACDACSSSSGSAATSSATFSNEREQFLRSLSSFLTVVRASWRRCGVDIDEAL